LVGLRQMPPAALPALEQRLVEAGIQATSNANPYGGTGGGWCGYDRGGRGWWIGHAWGGRRRLRGGAVM